MQYILPVNSIFSSNHLQEIREKIFVIENKEGTQAHQWQGKPDLNFWTPAMVLYDIENVKVSWSIDVAP